MSSPFVVRSIDIGYGNTKFVIDEQGRCELFPSLAVRANRRDLGSSLLAQRRTRHVWVQKEEFEVGPDTSLFHYTPVLHRDYIATPEYRALLYAALLAMEQPKIDLLVTGLPVHLIASQSERLKQLLRGVHSITPEHRVEIREVAVIAQPLGGFITHAHRSGFLTRSRARRNLLIDPGFRTFDWMVAQGLQEVQDLSGSVECAVADCLEKIEAAFCEDLNVSYTNLRKTEEGLRSGSFFFRGECIDLNRYRSAARPVVERAINHLRNKVGGADDIASIFLVGGGGSYFQDALREHYPKHPITIVDEPEFANVRGYQILGQMLTRTLAA